MFAYCGNNPVVYSDPSGNMWTHFFPSVADEYVAVPHFVGSSDGKRDSDGLLQHILTEYRPEHYPFDGSVVHISVEYSGVYSKNGILLDGALTLAGIAASSLPHPYAQIAGGAIAAVGVLDFVCSLFESLPDGQYFQYTVTMTWTKTISPVGFPDCFVTQNHLLVMTYVWNDSKIEFPSWQMIEKTHSASSTTWFR